MIVTLLGVDSSYRGDDIPWGFVWVDSHGVSCFMHIIAFIDASVSDSFRIILMFNYESLWMSAWEHRLPREAEERIISLELLLEVVVSWPGWVLGTELGFCAGEVHPLNYWAISPAPWSGSWIYRTSQFRPTRLVWDYRPAHRQLPAKMRLKVQSRCLITSLPSHNGKWFNGVKFILGDTRWECSALVYDRESLGYLSEIMWSYTTVISIEPIYQHGCNPLINYGVSQLVMAHTFDLALGS